MGKKEINQDSYLTIGSLQFYVAPTMIKQCLSNVCLIGGESVQPLLWSCSVFWRNYSGLCFGGGQRVRYCGGVVIHVFMVFCWLFLCKSIILKSDGLEELYLVSSSRR